MIAAYFVACLMSLAVSSATGLGVLLMATLFPVMVNGHQPRRCRRYLRFSGSDYSLPHFGDVVLAAKAAEMPLIDFAFKTTLLFLLWPLSAWRSLTFSGSATWIKKKTSPMKCSM